MRRNLTTILLITLLTIARIYGQPATTEVGGAIEEQSSSSSSSGAEEERQEAVSGSGSPAGSMPTTNSTNSTNSTDLSSSSSQGQKTVNISESKIIKNHTKEIPDDDEDQFTRTFPIFGNYTLGYYFVQVYVGESGQRQTLILDTGSSLTTFPCAGCSHCGKHYDLPFDPKGSELFKPVGCNGNSVFGWHCRNCQDGKCPYGQSYVEGSSYHGHFYQEYVYFEDELKTFLAKPDDERKKYLSVFGCTDRETNMFYTQEASGIFGIGLKTNATGLPPSLIEISTSENRVHSKGFSLCYGHEGGYMTIGGQNSHLHLENSTVQHVKFKNTGQFQVHIDAVMIDGNPSSVSERTFNSGQGAFFDSGTTLVHGSRAIVDGLYDGIKKFCQAHSGDKCGGFTQISYNARCFTPKFNDKFKDITAWLNSFPPLDFMFSGDAEYRWFPEDYFYYEVSKHTYCVGMEYYPGRLILGGIFMRHYDVYFDKHNATLRYVRSKCNSHDHVSTFKHFQRNEEIINGNKGSSSTASGPENNVLFNIGMFVMMVLLIMRIVYKCVFLNRYKRPDIEEFGMMEMTNTDAGDFDKEDEKEDMGYDDEYEQDVV